MLGKKTRDLVMDCSQWLLKIHYWQSNRDQKTVNPKELMPPWKAGAGRRKVLVQEEEGLASGRVSHTVLTTYLRQTNMCTYPSSSLSFL